MGSPSSSVASGGAMATTKSPVWPLSVSSAAHRAASVAPRFHGSLRSIALRIKTRANGSEKLGGYWQKEALKTLTMLLSVCRKWTEHQKQSTSAEAKQCQSEKECDIRKEEKAEELARAKGRAEQRLMGTQRRKGNRPCRSTIREGAVKRAS